MRFLLLVLWLLLPLPAYSQEDARALRPNADMAPHWTPRECGDPCVVRHSPGGEIGLFMDAADALVAQRRTLVIDGPCISACTIAAGMARRNVCVTPRAVFRFHKGYTDRFGATERFDLLHLYPEDIARWIRSKGGLPGDTVDDNSLLDMPYATARRFFRACPQRNA